MKNYYNVKMNLWRFVGTILPMQACKVVQCKRSMNRKLYGKNRIEIVKNVFFYFVKDFSIDRVWGRWAKRTMRKSEDEKVKWGRTENHIHEEFYVTSHWAMNKRWTIQHFIINTKTVYFWLRKQMNDTLYMCWCKLVVFVILCFFLRVFLARYAIYGWLLLLFVAHCLAYYCWCFV